MNFREWPGWLGWGLCVFAVLHTALLWTVHEPSLTAVYPVELLQPLAAIGCLLVMAAAAWRHTTAIGRWAWALNAIAIGFSVAGLLIQTIQRRFGQPLSQTLIEGLYLMTYVLAVGGVVLYLPHRLAWLTSALRVLLDSIAIGVAALVIFLCLQPTFESWRPWTLSAALYPAVDVGLVYALIVVTIRYGNAGGPLVRFGLASVIALLIADLMLSFLTVNLATQPWRFVTGPLFTLHRAFLALGAYYAASTPPQPTSETVELMPMHEWLLWALIPRAVSLIAIIAIVLNRVVPMSVSLTLLGLTLVREGLVAFNQHEVWQEAYALRQAERRARIAEAEARRAEHDAAKQTEDFLARLIHDQAPPIHGLWSVQQQASRAGQSALSNHLAVHLDHLQRLFDQLQTYLRVRMRPISLEIQAVDLLPIADAAVHALYRLAAERQIYVRLLLETEATIVRGEGTSIRRVLDNLLINALAATSAEGSVVLTLRDVQGQPEFLEIAVIDTGLGLSDDQQVRVFQPFVQAQTGPGLGLGLAIVQDIVETLGGSLGVESSPDRGSTFWIRFVRADGATEEHATDR